jgi:hypothetical protein
VENPADENVYTLRLWPAIIGHQRDDRPPCSVVADVLEDSLRLTVSDCTIAPRFVLVEAWNHYPILHKPPSHYCSRRELQEENTKSTTLFM